MKKDYSKYFGEDYYEKIDGYKIRNRQSITLGNHGNYRWEHKGQQNELAKKWNFLEKRLRSKWQKILFVGCGKGFELAFFNSRGKDAWGIDFSEYVVENAHPEIKDRVFREDICEIKRFGDNEFDVVASFDVLALVDRTKREKAIEKISRMASQHIVIRTKVLGDRIKRKNRIDIYDGAPVYLESSWYWVKLFEDYGKFRFQEATFYRSDFSKIWMVFKRK